MHPFRFAFMPVGIVLCLIAIGMTLSSAAVQAQSLPERPTLTPIAAPSSSKEPRPTAVPTGRITGTVIDLTTGAPAPGMNVSVGGVALTTDSNGNYERSGLAAGDYPVALVLTGAQGLAEQGPIMVSLADGATVIQHLNFRSPLLTVAPTAVPVPVALPQTGGDSGGIGVFAFGMLMILAAGLLRRKT